MPCWAGNDIWLASQNNRLPAWCAHGWLVYERIAGGGACQRVINSKGELSGSWAFGQQGKMRSLLEAEGIVFSAEGRVDLKRYGWGPTHDLTEEELHSILENAGNVHYEASPQLFRGIVVFVAQQRSR